MSTGVHAACAPAGYTPGSAVVVARGRAHLGGIVKRLPHLALTVALLVVVAAGVAAALPATATAFRLPLWTNLYGPTAEIDRWSDIARGPGHTVFVAGTIGLSQGAGSQMTLAKFSSTGTLVWETPTIPGVKTWHGFGASARGSSLAVDRHGDAIVAGYSSWSSGGFAVVKFSGVNGQVLWWQDLQLAGYASATDVAVDRDGNAFVTGTAVGDAAVGTVVYTVKLAAASGATRWQNLYSGPLLLSEGEALAIDANRNTYVIGRTVTTGTTVDWVTRKISPAGKSLWTRRWDGASHQSDLPFKVITTPKGGAIYVAGMSQTGVTGRYDAVLMRYSATGRRMWLRRFAKFETDSMPTGLCFDSHGALLLCGGRRPLDPTKPVASLLAKVATTGKTAWLRSSVSPFNADGDCFYADIVRGSSGSMYVSGSVEPSNTDSSILVENRRADGSLAWQAVNGSPDPGDDDAGRLILDGTTGLYVTGSFETTTGFIDAVLQGYKP